MEIFLLCNNTFLLQQLKSKNIKVSFVIKMDDTPNKILIIRLVNQMNSYIPRFRKIGSSINEINFLFYSMRHIGYNQIESC